MIEVKSAKVLGEGARQKISEIFVDGFGEHLRYFSNDTQTLADALAHMFVLDVFYVAVSDGEIAGITACTDGTVSSIKHNWRVLTRHLRLVRGTAANFVFNQEFQKPPMETGEKIASVEFVATASKFRGQGVATAIMNTLFALPQYEEYILEVADTNTNAVRLYEKLGYREFKRVKASHSKHSGINFLVYMKYRKPQD